MKSILATVIALSLAASSALAQTLIINTPNSPVECEPLLLTWSGGSPPYLVTINAPTDTTLLLPAFNATTATSVTWEVEAGVGTQLQFSVRDSTGNTDISGLVTVVAGPSSSCLGGTTTVTSFSFGATAASGATPTGQSPSASVTTPQSSNTATNSPNSSAPKASSGTTATSASSTSTASSGASRAAGQIAAAGIIGVAMVALLG